MQSSQPINFKMNKKFLLWMLAGIFSFQAVVFTVGVLYCGKHGGVGACPEIGRRYDQTFSVMIATVLSLLTGTVITKEGE